MWFDNPTFQDVDARLQTSPEITARWKTETSKSHFLKAGPGLYQALGIEE